MTADNQDGTRAVAAEDRGGAASLASLRIRRRHAPGEPSGPRGGVPPGESSAAPDLPEGIPVPPQQPLSRPEDIVGYWSALCRGRRYPARADLDGARIVAAWPDSILLRCRNGDKRLERAALCSADGDTPSGEIAFSPMMIEWILSLAGDALRERRPVKDAEIFELASGQVHYGAYALPLGESSSVADAVLCHVHRLPQ